MRDIDFQNDHYYHVFNRGVDKRVIFSDKYDYIRFIESMWDFNNVVPTGGLWARRKKKKVGLKNKADMNQQLVEIICYNLLPNHIHFLLKQLVECGISRYMHKICNGHSQYYNHKYKRSGSLFQGTYKAVPLKNQGRIFWISSYINGNAEIHGIEKADKWQWSSYPDYIGSRIGVLCRKDMLNEFSDIQDYKNFTMQVIKEARAIKNEITETLE